MTRRVLPPRIAAALAPAGSPGQAPGPLQMRAALGRFVTGVTVVTCCDVQGGWLGLTVNSFNALSLQPPLVLWSLRHASASFGPFVASPRFAVNVLAVHQSALSHRFATAGDNKFAPDAWHLGPHGAPVLSGCAAVFECETLSHQASGDHELFVGRVLACSQTDQPPLLYSGGHYHRLGARLRLDGNGDELPDDEL